MKQKLIAAAVVGAFAAPAAFAQSTVNIYGLLNAEYGFVSQPNNAAGLARHNADGFNSGASRIGFKGEEKLGSGMSAWFQCESDIRFLSGGTATSGTWCDRNSAIGLKGGFGSFFLGTWDSPLKQAVAKTRILNETGWVGVQHLLLAGDTFKNSNRNAQSINYETPKFGGFVARAQVTSTNAAFDKLDTTATKGRHIGFGADYSQGPLVVAAGMEKSDDNRAVVGGGGAGAEDTSYAIGATYVFGAFKPGVTYTNQKAEDGLGGDLKKSAWNLALDWKITAPGTVRFGYTQQSDYKGSEGANDTGAKMWQVGYQHALSKRTVAGVSYARIDNDNNGTANFTGLTNAVLGDNASVVVFNLGHTF